MELKHLQTFLTLSEIKNFTKTAEYLHYAQSNVSTQIQQLEEELGVRLFERIGKSITLTAEGNDLAFYARQILSLSKELKSNFASKAGGRITIGASESVCIYRLPAIIKAYRAEHPNVELYLNMIDTSDFVPLLTDNTIDIAFTLDAPISNPAIHTALQIEESICVFSVPEHPLAQKVKVDVHDFSGVSLILTGKGCCYRKMFERDLSKASVTPKIVLETSSLQVINQAARSGLGVCVLPLLAVKKELQNNELVKLNYTTNYQVFSQLIYHKNKWLSPNLKDFIDTVQNIVSKEGGLSKNI